MQVPLEIQFQDIGPSEAVEARVREETAKLEQFFDRITSTRVVVSKPHQKHLKGNTYRVRIHMTVPGGADIVIDRDPGDRDAHEDVYVTIRDAFRAARRQLQDHVRKHQGKVKTHESAPHGTIESLHPGEDHGFIATADGREIYFHRNSVANDGFNDLEAGQEVRFAEDVGDKGPQATIVTPVGKHHLT